MDDEELSTLVRGNTSSLLGVLWPIDGGCQDWMEPLKRRGTPADKTRLMMLGRPQECFIDERGDLGPYLRWLVALRLLLQPHGGQRWKDFYAEHTRKRRSTALELLSPKLKLDDGDLGNVFKRAFGHDTKNRWRTARIYTQGRLFDVIVEQLNATFPHRAPIDRVGFLEVRNLRDGETLEARTFAQFEHWLRHGVHPPNDDLGTLICEELLRSPVQRRDGGRGDQVDRVFRRLHSPAPALPVVNVYAPNCWTGLRAFATAVLDQLVTERGEGDPEVPLGLIYVRLSRSGGDSDAPTPASVVRRLRRAFGLPVELMPEGASRPFDLHAELLPIRRALTTYRTILVVDGLAHEEGPLAELFDMMRNSHWPELLRVLMEPHAPTLAQRGGNYPSRMLVLSSQPVSQLQPWMAEALALADVPRDVDARTLLVKDAARSERLRGVAKRLGACMSSEGRDLFLPLDDEQREALCAGLAPHEIPTELDLALACLHSGKDLRAMWQLHQTDGCVDLVPLRRQQLSRWMQAVVREPQGFADLLVLKFVCCSVNGLRLSTLHRCLLCWLELVGRHLTAAQAQQLRSFATDGRLESLAERFPQLVVLNRDEDVEAIGLRQRRFELQAFPDAEDTPLTAKDDRPLLDVRLEGIRELMFAEIIRGQSEGAGDAAANPLHRPRGEWELINLVLAEESLRQATAQLRNMEGHELGTPAVYRRLVQCVYHGLLSHGYDDRTADGSTRVQPTLPSFTLPAEPFRRFRYLYAFVFRHCIEDAPAWTLSRGFVRSEMRFLLAGMFANPRWGVELLANLHAMTSVQRRLRRGRDLLLSVSYSRLFGNGSSAWILRENALQTDILEALARSAYDTGRHGFARRLAYFVQHQRRTPQARAAASAGRATAVAQAASGVADTLQSQLSRIAASIDALHDLLGEASTRTPPGLQHDPVDHAFEKLMVDSRLARTHYGAAGAMCLRWLAAHGLDCAAFEGIGARYPRPNELAPGQSAKAQFEVNVLTPLIDRVRQAGASTRDRVALADMLSRLGESTAGLTDDTPQPSDRLDAFLSAYALFWIADRVRSNASGIDDSLAWPRVSSQAMRYFIRVSLKIARLLAEGAEPGSARQQDGFAFYAQARRRMDVYASHLFRLPRERLAMLLLMASATRVWSELCGPQVPPERRLVDLEASLAYLDQAQALLFRLGFPDVLAYRFFFERAKTYRRLAAHRGQGRGAVEQRLFERDRDALRTMSAQDPFWRRLAARLGDSEASPPHGGWFPGAVGMGAAG